MPRRGQRESRNPHERGTTGGNTRGGRAVVSQPFGSQTNIPQGVQPRPGPQTSVVGDPGKPFGGFGVRTNPSAIAFNMGFQNPGAFASRERGPAQQIVTDTGQVGFEATQQPFSPQEVTAGTGADVFSLEAGQEGGFGADDPGFGFGAPDPGGDGSGGDGPGGDGPGGGQNLATLVSGLADEIDKQAVADWLRTVVTNFDEVGLVTEDVNGDIIVEDRNGIEIARLSSTLARFGTGGTIDEQFRMAEFELEQQQAGANNAFREMELAQEARIADLQAAIERERIDADLAISQSRFDEAIAIQDRIDERERLSRELTRDLENARLELQNRTVEIDRARLDMERQRFQMEIATSPASLITLANMSRGFGPGQGPLPGGFQRIGAAGASGVFGTDFGTGPFGPAPVVQPERGRPDAGDVEPVQTGMGDTVGGPQPTEIGGPLPEGEAGLGTTPSTAALGDGGVPLPPGLAAAFQGQLPNQALGAAQLPAGSIPPLSDQQLAQLTPLEKMFYQDLIRLQGQRPEDFEAIRGAATPFQIPTSAVA